MKFSAMELVLLEEALRGMHQTNDVQRLLSRVEREKPRKLRHTIPNKKPNAPSDGVAK